MPAFSLTEMLVVIVIISALLLIGSVSFNALTAKTNSRLAAQAVAGAMRLARQYAIANHARCLVEIVAIDDNTLARPESPGTPYTRATEGDRDKIRILELRSVPVGNGTFRHVLQTGVLQECLLPANCVFDDQGGRKRYYPKNIRLETDYNGDKVPDGQLVTKICFEFQPDGACLCHAPEIPGAEDRNNVVRVKDLGSGESSTVVVMPATGAALVR
jgi:prepilin-type N-terminal cleavage/methylation domain-containing protein